MILSVHGTNHLYQECIKSDEKVLRYGSGPTERKGEHMDDAKNISPNLLVDKKDY